MPYHINHIIWSIFPITLDSNFKRRYISIVFAILLVPWCKYNLFYILDGIPINNLCALAFVLCHGQCGFLYGLWYTPKENRNHLKIQFITSYIMTAGLLSLIYTSRLPKRLHKMLKRDFRFPVPRKLVGVWYHLKGFSKLYNLTYSDSLVEF